mmetsp:Transcript_14701/g.31940  ORF Transcript_14701/g.31940 Transcript_14701/m.31940 type:complete len:104 (+) Transcript_14701:188-499(+)|eukprot:CAMPEP_0172315818 /NCGR_PEP_ID=MMETSP1058-20130122/26386_1 /TAXON_ID=83371 /ORGANISM="Detonula confervacea, Strain CCMP 353" /LENGTH=103 /DNA_ID=CAMNT_0013029985 /DNA_START=120 /DNA_END=431 /DNA_ORIENTATION=-
MTWIKKIFTTQFPPAQNRKSTSALSLYHRQLSSKKSGTASPPTTTLWKTLKAPAIFGVGLYFGLMVFGEHQETKQESAYFEALRYMFQDKDKKKKDVSDQNNG